MTCKKCRKPARPDSSYCWSCGDAVTLENSAEAVRRAAELGGVE